MAQIQDANSGKALLVKAILCFVPSAAWLWSDALFLPSLLLFINLYALSLYDLVSFRLPNLLTASLMLTGLMQAWVSEADLAPHFYGALAGLLFFPLLNVLYRRLRGRAGVGLGDAKLLAGIGMWLGWPLLPPVLLLSSIAGLVFGLYGVATKGGPLGTTRIPFGPFLGLGAWICWLYFPHVM